MSAEWNANLRIWNKVEKTDPKHTKAVSYGTRKFTAIDAHYQIMRATEVFGPVGEGWGYECEHSIQDGLAVCDVRLWYGGTRHQTFGPVRGMSAVRPKDNRLDDDCAKKAMTDALTKALSHLGFSADVFLGKFDDNKYVAALKAENDAARASTQLRPQGYDQDQPLPPDQQEYQLIDEFGEVVMFNRGGVDYHHILGVEKFCEELTKVVTDDPVGWWNESNKDTLAQIDGTFGHLPSWEKNPQGKPYTIGAQCRKIRKLAQPPYEQAEPPLQAPTEAG